jgi:hypothetical protein
MCEGSLDECDQMMKAWVDIIVGNIILLWFPLFSRPGFSKSAANSGQWRPFDLLWPSITSRGPKQQSRHTSKSSSFTKTNTSLSLLSLAFVDNSISHLSKTSAKWSRFSMILYTRRIPTTRSRPATRGRPRQRFESLAVMILS